MNYCHYLLVGLMVLFVSGCGQKNLEEPVILKQPVMQKSQIGKSRTIVVLPSAEYSLIDDAGLSAKSNLLVNENIVDQLVANGFNLPIQEDVFSYLVDKRLVDLPAVRIDTSVVAEEMAAGGWSDFMRKEISPHLASRSQQLDNANIASSGTDRFSFTAQEIVKIGRHFGADYVLRSRVVHYEGGQAPVWSPTNMSILNIDKNPQTVIQLRVWVQNAYTGDVVWTNRVNMRVSSELFFAGHKYNELLERAIEKGVYSLIDNFVGYQM